jgi:membrane-bound lytic murein transglycosylase MltF
VREELPLLAQQRWYDRAKRGYARGWEPVQFVDRIQRYLTLLEWQPGESVGTTLVAPAAAALAPPAAAPVVPVSVPTPSAANTPPASK